MPPIVAVAIIGAAIVIALIIVGNAAGKGHAPECRMNGMGMGSCAFTNSGDVPPWSLCGYVVLSSSDSGKSAKSGEFCSGYLWPKSTASIDFIVAGAREMCRTDPLHSWTEVCSLQFVPSE